MANTRSFIGAFVVLAGGSIKNAPAVYVDVSDDVHITVFKHRSLARIEVVEIVIVFAFFVIGVDNLITHVHNAVGETGTDQFLARGGNSS